MFSGTAKMLVTLFTKLKAYLSFRKVLEIIHRLLYTQHLICACVLEIF